MDVAVEQSDAEKDAELAALRKENARLKEANEILKLASLGSIRQRNSASYCSAGVRNPRTFRGRLLSLSAT